jgi:hypothetical protein
MKTAFKCGILDQPLAIKRLKAYPWENTITNVGFFSKTPNPTVAVLYIPGGVLPVNLRVDNRTMISNGPATFIWHWLPLWLNRNALIAVVCTPSTFVDEFPPTERTVPPRITVLNHIVSDMRLSFPGTPIMGYGHSYGGLEMATLATHNILDQIVIGSGPWARDIDTTDPFHNIYIKGLPITDDTCPILIVQHALDQTPKCSFMEAVKVMEKTTHGIKVYGGVPHRGHPGFEAGPHFFLTQENEVVRNILRWQAGLDYEKEID